MPSQEIQWTAVPYGIREEGGRKILSCSIVVVPRLQHDTTEPLTVNQYPDWHDWPTRLATAKLGLDVNGTKITGADVRIVSPKPRSDMWLAMIKTSTPVFPYEFKDPTKGKIYSFPVKGVRAALTEFHDTALKIGALSTPKLVDQRLQSSTMKANTQQEPDPALPLLEKIAALADDKLELSTRQMRARMEMMSNERWTSFARKAENGQPTTPAIRTIPKGPIAMQKSAPEQLVASPMGGTGLAVLHDVSMYHAPRNFALDNKRTKKIPIPKPEVDFHRILGYMRDYPRLQRLMGLVIDIEIDMPPGMPDTGRVMAVVDYTPSMGATTMRTPKTAYRRATPPGGTWYWLPRPQTEAGSLYNGPYYCLDNKAIFDLEQVDLDGQAIKTVEYARSVKGLATKLTQQKALREPRDITPPSTRGTGITLIQHGRALALAKNMIRATEQYNRNVTNTEVTLYAEDLMRGYRIDIWDDVGKTWQSVCRRDETYRFPSASGDLKSGITFDDEEGTLTNAATKPVAPPGEEEHDLYVHEGIASWDGWSMVVPRIGRYIDTEDQLSPKPANGTSVAKSEPGLHLYCETAVRVHKGSLPRLRYGRTYRMRARLVDIAGNAAKWNMLPSFDCASEDLLYMRWDPIVSPTIALTKDPVEAESLERMVIRNYNDQEDDSVDVETTEVSRRQVLAPLASQETSELHGMFDTMPTGPIKNDLATYNMITGHEGKLPEQWYKRDAAGNLVRATEAEKTSRKDLISYPVVESAAAIEPPYLPDPMGRGVTLRDVPGLASGEYMEVGLSGVNMATIDAPTGVATVCFDAFDSWPAIRSILIGMRTGTGKPSWDAAARTLFIEVPVGHTVKITFSSNCGETASEASDRLKLHGLWSGVKNRAGSAGKQTAAARGLAWAITPGRELTLVHATQRPLKRPKLIDAKVTVRNLASTNVTINFKDIYVHGRTTQKIDMHAEWDMWYDNLAEPGPRKVPEKAVVFEEHVEDVTKDKLSAVRTQEFGDTKYRGITYIPTATTRYREYIPASISKDAKRLQRVGTGSYLDIVSTKRPDTVDLVYVVPTFKWLESEKKLVGGVVTSTRKGGGLRVYMRRPWFSSGNGELLGVILYTSAKFVPAPTGKGGKDDLGASDEKGGMSIAAKDYAAAFKEAKTDVSMFSELASGGRLNIPDTLHPFVTQWGLDPIWLSKPTPSDNSPRVANFVDPKHVHTNVSIDEVDPKQRFIVVGFEPMYDAERQLWYCDLEIDPGESYYPFIRMSLCRYQPMSWRDNTGKDVYVSRVVQSEFCQIPPDRQATAKVEADGQSVSLTITGHTYRMNASGQQGSEIEVTIEQRDNAWGGNEELGWKQISTHRVDRIHAANAWAGMIKLPGAAMGGQFRLVVKEYEQFFSDPVGRARDGSLGQKGATGGGDVQLSVDKRIVYADVLPLY